MYMYSGVKLSMNSVQLIDFSLLFLTTVAVTYCGMAGRYWLNGYDTDNSGTFTWIDSQTPTNYTGTIINQMIMMAMIKNVLNQESIMEDSGMIIHAFLRNGLFVKGIHSMELFYRYSCKI